VTIFLTGYYNWGISKRIRKFSRYRDIGGIGFLYAAKNKERKYGMNERLLCKTRGINTTGFKTKANDFSLFFIW